MLWASVGSFLGSSWGLGVEGFMVFFGFEGLRLGFRVLEFRFCRATV